MDIVYVFIPWPADSVELRYSLRSVHNIPHRNIYIVGEVLPTRLNKDKIIHIPIKDDLNTKYENVIRKYKEICKHKNISDDFILMNDDIIIIKPITKIPYYTVWTLKEFAERRKNINNTGLYYQNIQKVLNLFPDGDAFNAHTPIIYNKNKLLKLLNKYDDGNISVRTLYCNEYKIKWKPYEQEFGRLDSKLNDNRIQNLEWIDNVTYISMNGDVNYMAKIYLDKILTPPYEYEL